MTSFIEKYGIRDFLSSNFKAIALVIVSLLFVFFVESFELLNSLQIIVACGISGFLLFVMFMFNPKLWLCFSAATVGFFVRYGTDGIQVGDVVFTLVFAVMNVAWLVWMIAVKKEKLIRNSADFLILIFFAVLLINAISTYENDINIARWAGVYILYLNILIYFPIRYYMKSKSDVTTILICFLLAGIYLTIKEIQYYRDNSLAEAVMAYQLAFKSHKNQIVFILVSFGSVVLGITSRNLIIRAILIGIAVVALGALVVSFARAFWLCYILGLVIAAFMLRSEVRKRFIVYITVVLIATVAVGSFALQNKAKYFFFMVEKMFTSTTKVKTDNSMQFRVYEFDAAKREIAQHPYSGTGIEYIFRYLHKAAPSFYYISRSPHNSYYYMSMTMGIPMAICFFFFIFFYASKALKYSWLSTDHKVRAYSIIAFTGLITLIIVSTITSVFIQRDASVVAAVCIFLTSYAESEYKKQKQLSSESQQWEPNVQLT